MVKNTFFENPCKSWHLGREEKRSSDRINGCREKVPGVPPTFGFAKVLVKLKF